METKAKTRGERIKAAREAKGWDQVELADKLGVTKGAVSKWENTASPDIGLATFFLLADKLEVDPRELALGKAKTSEEIPPHRVGLIQKYGNLPEELRFNIRSLIETLAAAQSDRYSKWSVERLDEVKARPQKRPVKEPSPGS